METVYQQQSSKFYLVSFIFLLVTLTGFVFYIKPLWDQVGSLALGRDDMLAEKTALQEELTSLQKVQQELNEGTEVGRETSLAAIPPTFEEDKLIMDIVNVTRQTKVSMNGISFGIPVGSPPGMIATATINLSLTGTESQMMNFLKGIEANSRKIVVKSVMVQRAAKEATVVAGTQPGGETQPDMAIFSVNMETYFQGEI